MSLSPQEDDHGLAAALAAYPAAGVTAITSQGLFCELPEALADLLVDHKELKGTSVFDLILPESWPTTINGWKRTLQHGMGAGAVKDVDGNDAYILCYDVRPAHDVLVMLMMPGTGDEAIEIPEDRPLTNRFGTLYRDVVGLVIGMDAGAEGLLGWSLEEIAALTPAELIHPDDGENCHENWLDMLGLPGRPQRWRGRHLHADGTWRWLEFTDTNRLHDPTHGHVVCEMMDISEQMATEEALRSQRELLARLNDALPLGVIQIDRDWKVVYANNHFYALVGREPSGDLGAVLADVAAEDLPLVLSAVESVLGEGTDQSVEVHLHLPSGPERICLVILRALRDGSGAITGAVICVSDMTEAVVLRRELEARATYDQLTGCHNRATTMTELHRVLRAADGGERRAGTAVIFIDLDRFKPVNDKLGHALGDRLLAVLADRLRAVVREHDLVGRLGGDEFLVLCPELASGSDAMPIAQRIAATLSRPVDIDGTVLRVGASVGVAWTDAPDATPDSLVAAADAAMYRSKREGRSEAVLA
jgi:diguanylate cyclase (GGDEF)-like protein/PAS domain S-box-containing protein